MTDARLRQWRRRQRLASALLAACVVGGGCRHLPPPLRGRALPACPGPLVATTAMPDDFLVRQRVLISSGHETWPLQLVAQKRGDVLTLLGFHPLGAKLFALQQHGERITLDAAPPPLLEVPPRNLLRDFHRERFFAVAAAGSDGRFRERRGELEILELREAGRVLERRFETIGDDPQRAVVLRFEPVSAAIDAAPRVSIENDACGYRAEITTLSDTTTPPAAEAQ